MAVKSNKELESFCTYVQNLYNAFSSRINVFTTPYKGTDLGYCYLYEDPATKVKAYNVFCFETGDVDLDLRVKVHEFGHINNAHLDGMHQELDHQILLTFRNYRAEVIELLNRECGIDYGSQLIDKVLNDRSINAEIHNIAMDMENNSTIIDIDDIKLMEEKLLDINAERQYPGLTEEQKQQIKNRNQVKLIHPSRYHTIGKNGEEIPFPSGLSYAEYLILIVKHLDQFIKMLVSLSKGGNGDTSNISSQEVADALNSMGNGSSGSGQDSQQQNQGDNLSDLNEKVFGSRQGQAETTKEAEARKAASGNNGGDQDQNDKTGSASGCDHGSDSRDKANDDAKNGQAGKGIGNSADANWRKVTKNTDPLSMALNEVIRNVKTTVIKWTHKRDLMRNYNRGIIRSVIAPAMVSKYVPKRETKIVFIIDISGSMRTDLVDRSIRTISKELKKIDGGLKYDIITCNTDVQDVFTDIDPKKSIPKIHSGGGTSIARGIKYFREHYKKNASLVIISDFEDYMQEWLEEEKHMKGYNIFGFNYGSKSGVEWKYLKERNF